MGINNKILLRNLAIAAAVVIGSIAFFSSIDDTGEIIEEETCGGSFESALKHLETVACPENYVKWGYDSPEECVDMEYALTDPEVCA